MQVAVIGEVVVDRFISGSSTTDIAGGSAANMALAFNRSGSPALLRARFSKDPNGEFLYQRALSAGLDLSLSVRADEPATLVEVFLADDGQPKYEFHLAGAADWQWTESELADTKGVELNAIVVGSIASVFEPGASAIRNWVLARRQTHQELLIAYDPNARPTALAQDASAARKTIQEWVELSDVVKVSDEDLRWISPERDEFATASWWSTLGPKLVVMTQGGEGATAFVNGADRVSVPGVATEVIDTVGAGDTFMAWLIKQILEHDEVSKLSTADIKVILERCAAAAAINCSRAGCNPPIPEDLTN